MCGGDSDPGVCSGEPYAGADKDGEWLFWLFVRIPGIFSAGVLHNCYVAGSMPAERG